MLDGLKSLITLQKLGTVSEAAIELRLTQSAVTKRIQALDNEVGYKVVERDGRKLRITVAGRELLTRARPLLVEFEGLKFLGKQKTMRSFSIGVADSIATSWGPSVLRRVLAKVPEMQLEIHVHRSTLIIENIKLGRYDIGLVSGQQNDRTLVSSQVMKEEMVLIGLPGKSQGKNTILTIETASATWREIGTLIFKHQQFDNTAFEFVESFSAAAQMARQGFGRALVPYGIAKTLGFKQNEFSSLTPKIHRQILLLTRKSIFELEIFKKFKEILQIEL